ncbi:MAG: DUF4132 domain-containing protein [Rhodobacteraceae bacterium]|nr:DUF4132 domain-containing protein [Paracoccaceae bacterium]
MTPAPLSELEEGMAQNLIGRMINDGRPSSGVLALATRTPPTQAAIAVRGYLRNHGKCYQQGRALLKLMAGIGQPETLQVLAVTAARQKQASLRNLATELLTEVAEAHGWTVEELEDRTVPDLGLDANGTLALPVADGKTYLARLGDDLAFRLENAAGKAVKSLPASQDETTKAAKKTLAAAKKELKQIAKAQAQRLYEAMCSERSWAVADWQRHYRDHPVMARLA